MSWLSSLTHALFRPANPKPWPAIGEVVTEAALQRAWPRSEAPWSVARLRHVVRRVHDGAWQPGTLRRRRRRKSSGGWRELGIPPEVDRAIQRAILDATEAHWAQRLDPRVFGYRPGATTWGAVTHLTTAAKPIRHPHLLQVDISDLFGTIPHAALEPILALWPDPIWRTLYPRWLNLWTATPRRGVPQGAPLSPLFANLALAVILDPALGKHPWIRWGDDVALAADSPRAATLAHDRIVAALQPAGMILAVHKTQRHTPHDLAQRPALVLGHHIHAKPRLTRWELTAERGAWDGGG